MATYLPNSNDYIAKSKSYTPDFKFLADVLGRRQDRYNTNYKQLNELYGKVVHADLSHEGNIHKRDEYANLLVPKIQQLTGTDFSLQQNADAARALFKPFFEDKQLVRDIVFTKRWNSQMGMAENYRKSPLEEERDKWWEDGVKRLNFHMQDFKEGTLEDIMTAQMPEYVQDPDLIERGIKYLQEFDDGKGLSVSDVIFSPDGKWMVTQENGSLLTHKPTGIINPETKEMTYYNPAANYISTTMADDPLIARGYATSAYVRAREFYENEDNIVKYGSKEGAERFFLQDIINQTKVKTEETITEEKEQKKQAEKTKNSWDHYLKTNPNQNTDEQQDYINALSAIAFINAGIDKQQTVLKDISRDGQDISELRSIAYQAYMHHAISKDIFTAAAEYADLTKKITKRELNPIWEKELDFQYKAALKSIELDNAKLLEDYKREQANVGLNLGGPGGLRSGAPDAEINADQYVQEDDKIGANKDFIDGLTTRPIISMLSVVEKAYGDLGPGWSDEENVFNSTGMEVEVFKWADGIGYMKNGNPTDREGKWVKQFMPWAEAKKYFLGQGKNQSDLEDAYKDVLIRYHDKIANDPNMSKPMFDVLNTLISNVEDEIKNDKLTIIELIENNNAAMKDAYDIVMKRNPDLKKYVGNFDASLFTNEDHPKMRTLPEFRKHLRDQFNKKAASLNLPKKLKTQEDIKKEMIASNSTASISGTYSKYIQDTLGPLAEKADMTLSQLLDTYYVTKLIPVGNQYGAEGNRKKPANVSDEVWLASQKRVSQNQTQGRAAHTGQLQLQSTDVAYSNLNLDTDEIYNNIYDAINYGMTSAHAGEGSFPTYDARRDYMLKNQTDDGSIMMTDNWEGAYWHGDSKQDITNQVVLAFSLINKLDRSFTSVKAGIPQDHVKGDEFGQLEDMEWDDNMAVLLTQIMMDLESTEEIDKAHRPNMYLTYNENVNGKSAITIQLDQKYVNKIRSNSTGNKLLALDELTNNTFTIYIDKDKYPNPMNINNMYVSRTKREIKMNGQYYHEVPEGGYIKAWTGTDGNVYAQLSQKKYNYDTKKYEESTTVTQILNISDRKIDQLMQTQRDRLNEIASENRIHKDKDTQ